LHQSRFRAGELGLRECRDFGNRLVTADALAGGNFYTAWPGLFDAVTKRYKLGDTRLYWDMLRSEHIPFNLFLPLREEPALLAAWVHKVTGERPKGGLRVEVEFAPKPKSAYLDDNTSFDAFVQYEREGGGLGGVGVEVKYTEGEYGYGKQERERMFAEDSRYHQVHARCGMYTEGSIASLRTKRFKQVWRNHLLGEAMVQRGDVTRFTSVLLFPEGNEHFVEATAAYPTLMVPEMRSRLVAQTFEGFLELMDAVGGSDRVTAWLAYLRRRYVHP
jgi:hypothetical protein